MNINVSLSLLVLVVTCLAFVMPSVAEENFLAFDDSDSLHVFEESNVLSGSEERSDLSDESADQIQAVLTSSKSLSISAPLDGKIIEIPFKHGQKFKKNDLLVKYQCASEEAKYSELEAKLSVSKRRLDAYLRLGEMNMVSDIEFETTKGQHKQDQALLKQAKAVLDMCVMAAPFSGRIQDIQIEVDEVVRSGRFLMKISSDEPLNVEMIVPSMWLRWLNLGASLDIYVKESDKFYSAAVSRIHGEVDPVSQSVRIVAKISDYEEELLPGMSGYAVFDKDLRTVSNGFMGLKVNANNDVKK